jgi:hypothetical protein
MGSVTNESIYSRNLAIHLRRDVPAAGQKEVLCHISEVNVNRWGGPKEFTELFKPHDAGTEPGRSGMAGLVAE